MLAGGPDREDRAGRKARPELEYSRVRQGWPLCCDTTNRLHGVAPGRLDLSLSSHESGRDGWAPALRRLPLQRAKRCIAQRLSFTASSWAPWAQQTRRAALRDRGAGRLSESRVPAPHRKCKHQAGAQLSALLRTALRLLCSQSLGAGRPLSESRDVGNKTLAIDREGRLRKRPRSRLPVRVDLVCLCGSISSACAALGQSRKSLLRPIRCARSGPPSTQPAYTVQRSCPRPPAAVRRGASNLYSPAEPRAQAGPTGAASSGRVGHGTGRRR